MGMKRKSMKSDTEHQTLVPALTTDKQAEAFLARDLSTLDFTQFKPMKPDAVMRPAPKRPT